MNTKGHLHPLSRMIREINSTFSQMGFDITNGPEIVSEYDNFDALNIPKDHPARDMHDTFWLKKESKTRNLLLRTHISALQVSYMKNHKSPFKMVSSGKVFRYEATDTTHEAQFHYTEGLVVGEKITFANLKATLEFFFEKLFQKKLKIRFRPSFFPFVEPGMEVDMSCFKCSSAQLITGKGGVCALCKQTGWIEVMGAGMVHPQVLKNGNIDPQKYKGFAFGTGIDRLVMLKYGIDDVRLFYNGDLRFVNQF